MKTEVEIALDTIRDGNSGHLFQYPENMLKLDRDKHHAEIQKQHPWNNCIGIRWIGRDTVKEPGDSFDWGDDAA